MPTEQLEQRTEDLERRVSRIEQVLPTLATKEDLKTTEETLRSGIKDAEQRLRDEIGDAEKRMRTHFDVVTESLRDDVRRCPPPAEGLRRSCRVRLSTDRNCARKWV